MCFNYLIDEALEDGDGTSKDCMKREEDIIGLDRNDSHGILVLVLFLDAVYPEQSHIVTSIEGEANNVQRQEIKIQSNHTRTGQFCCNLIF